MTVSATPLYHAPKPFSVVYTDGNGEPHLFRTMANSAGEATLTAKELIGPESKTVRCFLDTDWE